MRPRIAAGIALAAGLLLWPMLPKVPYDLVTTALFALQYLIVALSLVLLIGMVGQISLAQASLVGMGAFLGAIATKRFDVPFPFTLLVGVAGGAAIAALLGLVALRVRGLYLAVATMIFAFVADRYLFIQPWLVESQSGTSIGLQAIGERGTIPFFDLGNARTFYYVSLAVAVFSLYALANLRESKMGRAFSAIRGSEVAAASLGIDVTRYKLLGFVLAGGLAGLGGAVTLVGARTVAPGQFDFTNSLYFLSIAVVGGLRSLGGAVASALLFALLVGEVFFRFPALSDYRDVISGGLLLAVLLFFRGGLGALPSGVRLVAQRMRPRLEPFLRALRWGSGVLGDIVSVTVRPVRLILGMTARALRPLGAGLLALSKAVWVRLPRPPSVRSRGVAGTASPLDVVGLVEEASSRDQASSGEESPQEVSGEGSSILERVKTATEQGLVAGEEGFDGRRAPVLLSADGVTVRFGGLTAVDNASIKVGAGEIIGLIGPNGAGKTTLFNSILGLNQPAQGKVELFGQDVTDWDVHQRAALGVGRTFQILQLFSDLTVFENLLVATHLQNPTGLGGALAASGPAMQAELAAHRRVKAVLALMELEHLGDLPVAGLPFGVLRLIEVARTLVTGARLVCFDEPASGLDSTETDRLIEWFRLLRQIGVTLLVIEHDVSMVLRLCDYIYVLDQGKPISEGRPAHIRSDPEVVSAYLGAVPVEAT